ncbi:hypothetical protein QTP70_012934 [Hemibagrus guttatus]|uniref:Uncharacterized protein n=1 Tax=Hemibagrus guttatus TaxID=175788 RepID=A0AAE0Q2M3_9TELE|nr:hypothetical protein QTP70_012934 [Hemibagrus guttatus]
MPSILGERVGGPHSAPVSADERLDVFTSSRGCEMALLVLLFFFHLILDVNSRAQRNDVFNRLRSVKSSEVSCDYSLISDPTARSLMSDKYNLIRLFPTLTQPSITEISPAGFSPTQTQPSITTEKSPAVIFHLFNVSRNKHERLDVFTSSRGCEMALLVLLFFFHLILDVNSRAQRNDVFNRLRSVKSSEVSCDYSLISDPTARSLMSDKYNLIPFFPTLTQPSITDIKSPAGFSPTQTQPSITTEKSPAGRLPITLSVTGVCVLLAGLMSACLFMYIMKQKTRREAKAKGMAIFRVRNFSEADSMGSKGASSSPSSTTERSQEGSHGGHSPVTSVPVPSPDK